MLHLQDNIIKKYIWFDSNKRYLNIMQKNKKETIFFLIHFWKLKIFQKQIFLRTLVSRVSCMYIVLCKYMYAYSTLKK